ncbi:hypothetical protein RRG08_043687 [Elysia crispata]|uniref:BZIP domain-containing protein n=1 Tax=Elysia crispata TaxID=231223 RepID=A0AAE0ZV91_9GAST|nr:hypothetical protein RRG08_043687 [Elysia crispata]
MSCNKILLTANSPQDIVLFAAPKLYAGRLKLFTMAMSNGNHINLSATTASASNNNISSISNSDSNEPDSEAATMRMLMANLPSTAFNTSTPDPRLQRARLEMERTNQITPVLKEELRLRILHKRMEKGEPEIETGAAAEPKKYELTDEEKVKREKRKAQNRQAAKRCREKRKRNQLNEAEASELIREKNQKLAVEVRVLRQRYDYLMRFLQEHISDGRCKLVATNEVQDLAGATCYTVQEQLQQQHQQQQQQRLAEHSNGEDVSYRRPRSCAAVEADGVQVVEWVNLPPDLTDTVTISLPHTPLHSEDAPRITHELRPLSSEDVSAILPDDIDLNLSDPCSDSSSPTLNPSNMFSSLSDQSTSTSSLFQNAGGAFSPCSSSFAISDATSGLGTSLSFYSSDLSGNQASYSYANENLSLGNASSASFSAASTNDVAVYQQSNASRSEDQFSSFPPNGQFSFDQLPNLPQTKNDFSSSTNFRSLFSNESHSCETISESQFSNTSHQAGLHASTELQIKTEDDRSPAGWNTSFPFPQTTIETLIAILPNDANGSRPDNFTDIPKDIPSKNYASHITPQCSPATLSPASVCPDLVQAEHQSLLTDRTSPSSVSTTNYEHLMQRGISAWSSCPPATAVCMDSSAGSPCDPGTKVMLTPMIPSSSNATCGSGNMILNKHRAGIRRSSTGVSFPGAPVQALAATMFHGYATQLSSSSSSASSSTLSPPPSVPSPSPSSSHEVPESPSILIGANGCCDDGRGFAQHLSPIGAIVSAHPSSAHLEDISSDED